MNWTKRLGKWLAVSAVVGGTCVSVGCLTRPVGKQPPTTKVNFTSTVTQQQVDKVDLLFMIDNSASMGDKQLILSDAVPNLLKSLYQPNCVDPNGAPVGKKADPNGSKGNRFNCPAGSDPEFTPVTDMHIGIISSSLGSFGGDVCPDSGRSNDKAHLLNLTAAGPSADAGGSNFLSWFPTNEANGDAKRHPPPSTPPVVDPAKLETDFVELVKGVAQTGCGLEAQLESFYRFLIQPDPWVSVKLVGTPIPNQADLGAPSEIDFELLKQRADFLREDSLVAIIELTDEDDSSADPLSVGGQGWGFMASQFPGSTVSRAAGNSTTAPRATSVCATNPKADGKDGKVACTSCGFAALCNGSDPACQLIKNDPECKKNGGFYGPTEEDINVRFHRMKERFGIDPQYPIKRYVDGLTKARVPDRSSEHTVKARANGFDISGYIGTAKCTNPLFAKGLPRAAGQDVCALQRSTRGPELIFFAVVGGVPNKLLHFDPTSAEKSKIVNDDWNKILGRDPANFDYTGIDPHMIQSVAPRTGVPGASQTRGDNGPPNGAGTDDPVGRDWDTGRDADDLQYACTFALPTPRKCGVGDKSCDCASGKNPPLCGPTPGDQIRAKAYPTIREFQVVRALGDQGVIASLCPISLTVPKDDPTYGYNPAVTAIVDRLKNALTTQCLPQKLTRSSDPIDKDQVSCLVLAQLGDVKDTCPAPLVPPSPEILAKFVEQKKAESGDLRDGGTDLSKFPVCVLPQIVAAPGATCKDNPDKGWCYVENGNGQSPAGKCPQAVIFSSATAALVGAQFSLQCIQQFSEGAGGN